MFVKTPTNRFDANGSRNSYVDKIVGQEKEMINHRRHLCSTLWLAPLTRITLLKFAAVYPARPVTVVIFVDTL